MEFVELTDREKSVLRYVIHQFILTANPVGSRNIAKKYDIGFSPATVRNVMSDLEEYGYLDHPHTSAGRIPTDVGYRIYVDSLMDPPHLGKLDKKRIDSELDHNISEADELFRLTSTILSELTNQLACVTYPRFENAVLAKLQLVRLSSSRILVVISLRSGLVNTITLEITTDVSKENLEGVQKVLNQRLAGLKLSEIQNSLKERIQDYYNSKYQPIIRLFLESADKIFSGLNSSGKSIITGAKNILKQPEFVDQKEVQGIIELIEEKDVIVHILEEGDNSEHQLKIVIGSESNSERFTNFSLIKTEYKVGETSGILGVIGPKRMEYSKAVAAIVYIAETLSKQLKQVNN